MARARYRLRRLNGQSVSPSAADAIPEVNAIATTQRRACPAAQMMSQNCPPDQSLEPLLAAQSVAIVGASQRPGSAGYTMVSEIKSGGFMGPVYPINPGYDEVLGLPCYATLNELPEPVDLVILGVKNSLLEGQLQLAADCGVRAAVIFASCYEEPRDDTPPLNTRLSEIARAHRMPICGGNGMGFFNLENGLRALAYPELSDLETGPITWLSHSGSAYTAMTHNKRGLKFNLAVSAGMELTTTVSDYMKYALGLESTGVIAMFLETVRDPVGFREALTLANARDIPVVVLKAGREALARELIIAHSGGLAGEDGAYEAVFREYGVTRVANLDEMVDTLELFAAGRSAAPGGLAAIHDSGGERAHLIDVAGEVNIPLAQISDETAGRMATVLDPGLPAVNPVDAWGTGYDYEAIFCECMRALIADPNTAALGFVVDLADYIHDAGQGYDRMAAQIFSETDKPVAVLSNLTSAIPEDSATLIRDAGVPLLEGTASGLTAFRALFDRRDFAALPPLTIPTPVSRAVRERWRNRLREDAPWDEHEGLALLRDYGIPAAGGKIAHSAADALGAADAIGWPVALKTAAPGVPHKSDVGGVSLGVDNPAELERAYKDLVERLGPPVLVQRMAPAGVELLVGVVRDAQFGPLVMAGAGGILVETFCERAFALPPLDRPRTERLLAGLTTNKLLAGIRGSAPSDTTAVINALVRLSVLATDLGDLIDGLDINPLIAGPDGCIAVDALVVPKATEEFRKANG